MERWQSRKPAEADPGVIADWWKSRPTYVALSVIERWQWSNSTIIETLAEIAADFRHARQQLRDAERALNERDYQAAGLCYAEVAGICLKHCRSEEVIVRMVQEQAARIGQPSPDLDYDNVLKAKKEVDAHIEVVPEFFAAQALEYQQKAYANLLLADAAEPQPEPGQRLNLSDEKRQERYRVLSVLAQLAQSFGEIPAANTYQARADRYAPPLTEKTSSSEGEDPAVHAVVHLTRTPEVASVLRKRVLLRHSSTADPVGAPVPHDPFEPSPV